jgi:hypothetical protein
MFNFDQFSSAFWNLIYQAHGSANALEGVLSAQSKDVIKRFHLELEMAHAILSNTNCDRILRLDRQLSDDMIDDYYGYIILRGKKYYEKIANNPELAPQSIPSDTCLQGLAAYVYRKRFGELIDIPNGMPQPIPVAGKLTSLIIPLNGAEPSERDIQDQEIIINDLKTAGYGNRKGSTAWEPDTGMIMYYVIEDDSTFRSVVKTIFDKHFPSRTFRTEVVAD